MQARIERDSLAFQARLEHVTLESAPQQATMESTMESLAQKMAQNMERQAEQSQADRIAAEKNSEAQLKALSESLNRNFAESVDTLKRTTQEFVSENFASQGATSSQGATE